MSGLGVLRHPHSSSPRRTTSLTWPKSRKQSRKLEGLRLYAVRVLVVVLDARAKLYRTGAGISVQAGVLPTVSAHPVLTDKLGIPDFRSPAGLFHTLKRDNPKESLSSGKDLFDASVFRREATTALVRSYHHECGLVTDASASSSVKWLASWRSSQKQLTPPPSIAC
jgi:hypothetical protein